MTLVECDNEIARLTKLRLSLVARHLAEQVCFKVQFDIAWNKLNRDNGSHNFVKLEDIRPMLPNYSKEQFDSELRKLRIAAIYTLSAAEGRHGITQRQREASIMEDGSMLSYVSRRNM